MPRKKEFKLTLESYFDPQRPMISVSQINDYIRSPDLYYRKYVLKTVPRVVTNSMKLGLCVDALLTHGDKGSAFQPKVLKKDDVEQYEAQKEISEEFLLPADLFLKAQTLAKTIQSQPFWTQGKTSFQVPLSGFIGKTQVCGLLDRVDYFPARQAQISDLKITSEMKITSSRKWLRNAVDMGYLRQAAMYRYLLAVKLRKDEKDIPFFHIVASISSDLVVTIKLFKLPTRLINDAMEEIERALEGIRLKQWKVKPLTWDDIYDFNSEEWEN